MSKVEFIEPTTQGQVLMLTNEKLGETPQLVACSFSEDFDFITRAFLDQPVKYMKKPQSRDVFLVAHINFNFAQITFAGAFDKAQVADVAAMHANRGQQFAEVTRFVGDIRAQIFDQIVGGTFVEHKDVKQELNRPKTDFGL